MLGESATALAVLDGNFSADLAAMRDVSGQVADGGCPLRAFDPNRTGSGAAKCFCQLAKNPTCSNGGCSCSGTCGRPVNQQQEVATFMNLRSASGCQRSDGLLTIPRSYFRDIRALRDDCSDPTELMASMLRHGYSMYQSWVTQGPVLQCVHASGHISVPWLHLHTFCQGGNLDGMPTSNSVALCVTMNSDQDAHGLAQTFISWAH